MHSVAMSDVRSLRDSRLTVVRSPLRTDHPSPEFVRLSQLRKLRECAQVAAVCYRIRAGGIEFLLVQTRGGGRWTFPKGGAEPGLTHAQAAALEAFEEAGVHGRIEEASFARYVLGKRGGASKSSKRPGEKELAVNAHLCEVLRLGPPKESNRHRTWFPVEDARRRLGEGRGRDDGAEFARVVDRAVARIQRLCAETDMVNDQPQPDRPPRDRARGDAPQDDALQKVQFEAGAYGWTAASHMPYFHRQLGDVRQSAMPMIDARRREVLPCEVLEFGSPRGRKDKALGTGAKND
jgi:8-oxo-dGTP pyrophosphatase MutT (NUDIX family)